MTQEVAWIKLAFMSNSGWVTCSLDTEENQCNNCMSIKNLSLSTVLEYFVAKALELLFASSVAF